MCISVDAITVKIDLKISSTSGNNAKTMLGQFWGTLYRYSSGIWLNDVAKMS